MAYQDANRTSRTSVCKDGIKRHNNISAGQIKIKDPEQNQPLHHQYTSSQILIAQEVCEFLHSSS